MHQHQIWQSAVTSCSWRPPRPLSITPVTNTVKYKQALEFIRTHGYAISMKAAENGPTKVLTFTPDIMAWAAINAAEDMISVFLMTYHNTAFPVAHPPPVLCSVPKPIWILRWRWARRSPPAVGFGCHQVHELVPTGRWYAQHLLLIPPAEKYALCNFG